MSDKPEDISQEAWDEANAAMDRVGWFMRSVRVACAEAIMAATERERSRLAEWADALGDHHDALAIAADDEAAVVEHRAIERAFYNFASAIRQGAQPPKPSNDDFRRVPHNGEIA